MGLEGVSSTPVRDSERVKQAQISLSVAGNVLSDPSPSGNLKTDSVSESSPSTPDTAVSDQPAVPRPGVPASPAGNLLDTLRVLNLLQL